MTGDVIQVITANEYFTPGIARCRTGRNEGADFHQSLWVVYKPFCKL